MDWPEITKETTRDELIAIHKKIWDYVVEYGEKPKTPYLGHCVGCEVCIIIGKTLKTTDAHSICFHCPIKWPDGVDCMNKRYMSLYYVWAHEEDPIQQRHYAEQIRDIEFKDDIWEEKQ